MSKHQKAEAIRKSLEETMGPVEWSLLRKHAARDVIIIVDPSLNVLDVGTAIALNDQDLVQQWIVQGTLTKPSPEQYATWETNLKLEFISLIVQPFVLIQILN